jgi:hypothetical protein
MLKFAPMKIKTGVSLAFVGCLFGLSACFAQTVPAHAQGLKETLISVDLVDGKRQLGVLSVPIGREQPTRLALLLPGNPSVVRPVVENNVMSSAELGGNFLIRARRFLADELIATMIVECQSGEANYCAS